MTIIMLIMMFTLLLLLASQGSLALVPEGMWHNNNNNNIVSQVCSGASRVILVFCSFSFTGSSIHAVPRHCTAPLVC